MKARVLDKVYIDTDILFTSWREKWTILIYICYLWTESGKNKVQLNDEKKTKEEKSVGGDELTEQSNDGSSSSSVLTCIDKLREELSCAVRTFALNILLLVLNLHWTKQIGLYVVLVTGILRNLQICLEICFEPSTTTCGHR